MKLRNAKQIVDALLDSESEHLFSSEDAAMEHLWNTLSPQGRSFYINVARGSGDFIPSGMAHQDWKSLGSFKSLVLQTAKQYNDILPSAQNFRAIVGRDGATKLTGGGYTVSAHALKDVTLDESCRGK